MKIKKKTKNKIATVLRLRSKKGDDPLWVPTDGRSSGERA